MPIVRRVVRMTSFMPFLILFGAWQLPGLKLPECQLRKSVVWLPGRPRVRLPSIIIWTLLGSLLALRSLTWLWEDDREKAIAEHHFPPRYLSIWLLPLVLDSGF